MKMPKAGTSRGVDPGAAGQAKKGLVVTGSFVALLFIVELLNALTLRNLTAEFGLRPRNPGSLPDILTFPLLHANLGHLTSNALPFIIFGFLVFLSGVRVFATTLALSWLGSGVSVWLAGGSGVTVGASGLVFGLFAFLLVRGFLNRNWWQILLSAVLFMAYGSILLGALPIVAGHISWQAHLGGAIGGVVAALVLRRTRR